MAQLGYLSMHQHFAHGGLELTKEDCKEDGDWEESEGGGCEDDGLGNALAGVVESGQGEGKGAVFVCEKEKVEQVFVPGQNEVKGSVGE